jgi:hypothetical protein
MTYMDDDEGVADDLFSETENDVLRRENFDLKQLVKSLMGALQVVEHRVPEHLLSLTSIHNLTIMHDRDGLTARIKVPHCGS